MQEEYRVAAQETDMVDEAEENDELVIEEEAVPVKKVYTAKDKLNLITEANGHY